MKHDGRRPPYCLHCKQIMHSDAWFAESPRALVLWRRRHYVVRHRRSVCNFSFQLIIHHVLDIKRVMAQRRDISVDSCCRIFNTVNDAARKFRWSYLGCRLSGKISNLSEMFIYICLYIYIFGYIGLICIYFLLFQFMSAMEQSGGIRN